MTGKLGMMVGLEAKLPSCPERNKLNESVETHPFPEGRRCIGLDIREQWVPLLFPIFQISGGHLLKSTPPT